MVQIRPDAFPFTITEDEVSAARVELARIRDLTTADITEADRRLPDTLGGTIVAATWSEMDVTGVESGVVFTNGTQVLARQMVREIDRRFYIRVRPYFRTDAVSIGDSATGEANEEAWCDSTFSALLPFRGSRGYGRYYINDAMRYEIWDTVPVYECNKFLPLAQRLADIVLMGIQGQPR